MEQHRHTTGKALLALDIGNGHRLLMFPGPAAGRFLHRGGGKLSTFLVPLPVMIEHAVPTRVVKGKIQQLASGQVQQRGSELLECVGQAGGARDVIGDFEQHPVPVVFWRDILRAFHSVLRHGDTSCHVRAKVGQPTFEKEPGPLQLCQAAGTLSHCGTQASVPPWEPISFSPDGRPPQVLRSVVLVVLYDARVTANIVRVAESGVNLHAFSRCLLFAF